MRWTDRSQWEQYLKKKYKHTWHISPLQVFTCKRIAAPCHEILFQGLDSGNQFPSSAKHDSWKNKIIFYMKNECVLNLV